MNPPPKPRIAVFGSFYRGFYVLSELLNGALKDRVQVVGVATDDPSQSYISRHVRVWQYPHTQEETRLVPELAARHGLEVYTGRVKTPAFYEVFEQQWQPDLCIMATFGQLIDARLFEYPRLGFFNLHPCIDDGWPSRFAGSNPFQALLDCHSPCTMIAIHRVNEAFDAGELVAYSEPVAIPAAASVVDLHKITSPTAARLAAREIARMLDAAHP